MVGRSFTIAAFLILSAGSAHAQTVRGPTAQAIASATILHSAALRVDPRSPRLETAMLENTIATRTPRRTVRPCDAENPTRCTLIVFDLP